MDTTNCSYNHSRQAAEAPGSTNTHTHKYTQNMVFQALRLMHMLPLRTTRSNYSKQQRIKIYRQAGFIYIARYKHRHNSKGFTEAKKKIEWIRWNIYSYSIFIYNYTHINTCGYSTGINVCMLCWAYNLRILDFFFFSLLPVAFFVSRILNSCVFRLFFF